MLILIDFAQFFVFVRRLFNYMLIVLEAIALINSMFIIHCWMNLELPQGLLKDPYLDGCFIALCYPLIFAKPSIYVDHTGKVLMSWVHLIGIILAVLYPAIACFLLGDRISLFLIGLSVCAYIFAVQNPKLSFAKTLPPWVFSTLATLLAFLVSTCFRMKGGN
jgi:hypothetical protein